MNRVLSDQPALLQAILDTSVAAVCVLDPKGHIIFANPKAEDILGLKPSEIVKRDYDAPEWKSTAVDGGPWPDENQPFTRVMQTGKPVFDIRHAIEWPDGRRKLLSINGAPIKNERGEIVSLVFLVTDITESARIEQRMRENADWLEMALESAQMGIWSWNIESGQVRWSDEVEQLFGLAAGDFGGKYEDYLDLIHPDDRGPVVDTIESNLRSKSEAYEVEHRLLWPDGQVRWVEARGRVFRDDAGLPIQMTGTVTDITGRKMAERALRDSEEKLRQSQRLESVGRLAGGIAHDFNNLLTAIVGCSDMLRSRLSDTPEGLEFVHGILDAAERGAELTRQLLTFAHQGVVRPQIVDLNQRITDINQMLPRLIGENITLSTELAPDLWPVEVDPGQFEQVIVNLAINARDAMPDGGRLTITTENGEIDAPYTAGKRGLDGREWVVLSVTDTGVGMDAETLQLAFEPFFSTKQSGEGTGLGLATCFGIVRQAGGQIEAKSEPGCGTRFRLYFPRSQKPLEPDQGGPKQAQPSAGNETILLVEDESSVRRVVAAMLKDSGYQLLEACCGDEALELFESHDGCIDLLVTDVVMPGMGGADLASKLLRRSPDLKVLLVSGYSPDFGSLGEIAERGVELMQKPFSQDGLSKKIRALLETNSENIGAD